MSFLIGSIERKNGSSYGNSFDRVTIVSFRWENGFTVHVEAEEALLRSLTLGTSHSRSFSGSRIASISRNDSNEEAALDAARIPLQIYAKSWKSNFLLLMPPVLSRSTWYRGCYHLAGACTTATGNAKINAKGRGRGGRRGDSFLALAWDENRAAEGVYRYAKST